MLIAWLDRETLGPVLRAILRVGPVLGGVALLLWRVRETQVPITVTSIVIPPLAMSSAFGMFLAPLTRIPWSWAVSALLFGLVVLSWPLVRSSRLELREGVVYLKRSRAFLAFGMIVRWRVGMFLQYRHIAAADRRRDEP